MLLWFERSGTGFGAIALAGVSGTGFGAFVLLLSTAFLFPVVSTFVLLPPSYVLLLLLWS